MIAAVALAAYTNLAGRAITATPVKVEHEVVTFDCGAQGLRPLPIGIFPSCEQARIKAAVGAREMPGELRALAAEIESQRRRVEARHHAGRMSDAQLAEYLENLAGSWRHAVDAAYLSDADKAYWRDWAANGKPSSNPTN